MSALLSLESYTVRYTLVVTARERQAYVCDTATSESSGSSAELTKKKKKVGESATGDLGRSACEDEDDCARDERKSRPFGQMTRGTFLTREPSCGQTQVAGVLVA